MKFMWLQRLGVSQRQPGTLGVRIIRSTPSTVNALPTIVYALCDLTTAEEHSHRAHHAPPDHHKTTTPPQPPNSPLRAQVTSAVTFLRLSQQQRLSAKMFRFVLLAFSLFCFVGRVRACGISPRFSLD
jgi:hypothetical protein